MYFISTKSFPGKLKNVKMKIEKTENVKVKFQKSLKKHFISRLESLLTKSCYQNYPHLEKTKRNVTFLTLLKVGENVSINQLL